MVYQSCTGLYNVMLSRLLSLLVIDTSCLGGNYCSTSASEVDSDILYFRGEEETENNVMTPLWMNECRDSLWYCLVSVWLDSLSL